MLPTVAEVLELEPVRRGGPRVLSCADRLNAPVRWVHVMELAEAGHLLRGGELVLSTGIALPPDSDGLSRYVAGLAAAGVSALAVELGSRYVTALPGALITAATTAGLPLIVFERETQFIAITEAVHAQILDAQHAELVASRRLHEVFTDLALSGAGQDEIVARAADLAGHPVILADLAHRVLACAPAGRDLGGLLDGFAARSRAVKLPGRTGYDATAGWLVSVVGSPDGDWARLIFALPWPPDPGAPVLAERAAATLTLARLTRRSGGDNPLGAAHRSLLAALAGRGPATAHPADLEARVTALGVPLAGRQLVAVVIVPEGASVQQSSAQQAGAQQTRAEAVSAQLEATCHDLRIPAIAGALDSRTAAAMLALAPGADEDVALTSLALRLRRAGALGQAQFLGVGAAAGSVGELRSAFGWAADAASAAAVSPPEARPGRPPYLRLEDLGIAGLAFQLRDDPRAAAFAEHQLGPLLRHDAAHGTGLAELLAAYLSSGNKAATAARCGIARPTLYERLHLIEQLLGVRLDDGGTRTALDAALFMHRAQVSDQRYAPPRQAR